MKNTLGASFIGNFDKAPIIKPKPHTTDYIIINKDSVLLQLPEKTYGTIKRVGILNTEAILYGDPNLLKQGQLYYMSSVKQVYRFVKANNASCFFSTIKPKSPDGLLVAEEEKGHIRNAGYLFNEIIYSGDPNLIENGSLFYHDTLPYVSIISNVDGIINVSTKELNPQNQIVTIVTEYRVSPEPHDYGGDYFTIQFLQDGTLDGDFDYRLNNGDWITLSDSSINCENGDIVQLRSAGSISTTATVNISGNIMSLTNGDNFENAELTEESQFESLFANWSIISAKNLILPTNVTEGCYAGMFNGCTTLVEAPEILPATTLEMECYSGMFSGCTSLEKAPELPAETLVTDCYVAMFKDCTSLKYIKAMFTTTPTPEYTQQWVQNVPQETDGIFVKNANATWDVVAGVSNNYCGSPLHWQIKKEVPHYDPVNDEINI